MTLFRGYGDDLPLMGGCGRGSGRSRRSSTPEDVYWGTRLACVEMIRTGTARFLDMYWHGGDVARAVRRLRPARDDRRA